MNTLGPSTLFDLLPVGAYRSSVDGRQLRANAALVRLNGYDSEAEMLAAVNDIAREWYVDPLRRIEFAERLQRDGQVVDFVSEVHRHKTRERLWIRENAHVVRGDDGLVQYFEGTVEDITRQRRTELALQASEQRFRAFTERSQVLTVLCDALGRVQYVSPASMRLLGRAPDQLLHSCVFEWLHPDDVEPARQALVEVLDFSTDEEETTFRVGHADGGWRHLAILSNNRLADPAVAGIVLNLRDVSGRVRAEAAMLELNAELEQRVRQRTLELQRSRDEAEAANRAKSDFLSRMSHELRTPMNAILGFGQLLQSDVTLSLTAAQRGHVDKLLHAGEQLLALIDQLLDLSMLEAGQLSLALQPTCLGVLARECLDAAAPLALQLGVQLLPPAADAGELGVLADGQRLRQVLSNLLSHALRQCRPGGQVGLGFEAAGAAVRIVVCDNGAGMDARAQQRLFQAFEALDGDNQVVDGAGVGLALSKRLVELMHGQIGLDSHSGVGSRYWVELPRTPPAPTGVAHAGSVLYIEDNAVNVLLMEALLRQQTRLRLLSAALPEDGLQLARDEHPDLILLDIQLPGIDGYEVLLRLRADPRTRDVPVIALSANAMPADLQRGREAGFDDYVTKPINQPMLLQAMRRALGFPIERG